MKTFKMVLSILVGLFVLMSLLPYGKRENPQSDPKLALEAPKNVKQIFKRSCYDCHSNHTVWPWYSYVFPLSWSVIDHVRNGRAALNFDEWKKYDREKRAELKDDIARKSGVSMPLKGYLWFHKDAKLSKEDIKIIREWAYKDE
ncbi:hypothetical protein MNB_SM-7-388 [hydrothermal vent metagenome]|uniref:Haem-binding domain-containing protein n=1 Tax=hydrothermal vent metagenome TaxID=652676 RepID=A0A1W1BS96_9ZZZZ